MRDYEIVFTYLNGCAGAAYPQTDFEEATLADPADYIRRKHGKDFPNFVKEVISDTQVVYRFHNGAVTYIYEFTAL